MVVLFSEMLFYHFIYYFYLFIYLISYLYKPRYIYKVYTCYNSIINVNKLRKPVKRETSSVTLVL